MSRAPKACSLNMPVVRAVALLAAVLIPFLLAACASTAQPLQRFGERVSGQHVYDRAGILTPDEIADLETHAAAVERAGAPTVVYLQVRDASRDETIQDGRDLMQAWNAESSSGARDGVVIFVNLLSDNERHGEAAIIAGQKWNDKGVLTDRENQRIYDEVMAPLMKDEKTAAGIARGLDALAHDLTVGPPPVSMWQRAADYLAAWPLIMLAGLLILALAMLIARSPRRKRPPTLLESAQLDPPDDLAPALAGALTAGRVLDSQIDAILLDLARRGIIAMEPDDDEALGIRILQSAPDLNGYEQRLFATITEVAGPDGVIPAQDVLKLRLEYNPTREALHDELVARGWFARKVVTHPTRLRELGLLRWLATTSIVVAVVTFIVAAIAQSMLTTGVSIVLFIVALASYGVAASVPDTTETGEIAALPWRAYRANLKTQAKQRAAPLIMPEWLDRQIPLVIALGLGQAFNPLLNAASAAGYAPAWLGWPSNDEGAEFFPYWSAFHASGSSSGGGDGGAGASAGSSVGGGHF
ncbi:MAG TPA: TPM domain-containing protein [Ktedonobacterales bacterium]|nr:TPM domain-containing protein [Ktedonobacterales bacterium]